ncbi:MAG: L-fucose mutarotase [Firmicutes bacterium]|nr:L-fucose mutarotase [Bacillota bacterium]
MLKNISPLISPELLKILAEMGHGDTVVLADANYPACSGGAKHVVRADGIGVPTLLEAILPLLPLDTFVAKPITLMEVVPGDNYVPDIWNEYRRIFNNNDLNDDQLETIERFAFYEHADTAYCVVATGERARYANVILKKGIIEA